MRKRRNNMSETKTNVSINVEDLSSFGKDGGLSRAASASVLIERILKISIIGVLFGLLYRDELLRLLGTWSTASESHGILIPAFSLYFIYQEREYLRQTVGKPNYLGLLILFSSMAVYVLSITSRFGYPRPIMMITSISGLVLLLGGWPIFKRMWLPVFFLIFAIRLPGFLHEAITIPMRIWASSASTVVLNFFPGVICESSNVLINGTHYGEPFNLNIAEACSGMRLLRTFVALGVAMAYLEYRPASHRLILLGSTIPIAIFCNMLRVLVTGLIYIYFGPEYAQGMLHMALGMVMLFIAFGLYGVLAWVMNNIYNDNEEENEGDVLVIGNHE